MDSTEYNLRVQRAGEMSGDVKDPGYLGNFQLNLAIQGLLVAPESKLKFDINHKPFHLCRWMGEVGDEFKIGRHWIVPAESVKES